MGRHLQGSGRIIKCDTEGIKESFNAVGGSRLPAGDPISESRDRLRLYLGWQGQRLKKEAGEIERFLQEILEMPFTK